MAESNIPQQPWSFDPSLTWQLLEQKPFEETISNIWQIQADQLPADAHLYLMELPFYKKHKLYCLRGTVEGELRHCFMLFGDRVCVLNGVSNGIHEINFVEPVHVTKDYAPMYLRFFCSFVYGDMGPFLPIENAANFHIPENLDAKAREYASRTLNILKSTIAPVELIESNADNNLYNTYILYGDAIFMSKMKVSETGSVEMLGDDPVVTNIPQGMIPLAPKAYMIHDLLSEPSASSSQASKLSAVELINRIKQQDRATNSKSSTSTSDVSSQQANSQSSDVSKPRFNNDREITRFYIATLIRHALEKNPQYDVMTDFNKTASSNDAVADFGKFVMKHGPVVLIESDFPYIEELVAELVAEQNHYKKPNIMRISKIDNEYKEQPSATLMIMDSNDLISASSSTSLERLAFDISMSRHPVFIGTNHSANLNDAIQKVVEFKVSIPRLNEDLFKILFSRIFGGNLPRSWNKSSTQWLQYLNAHDFHQPYKAGLSGAKAFSYLHHRVKARLQSVETSSSPNLQDLHGMAEAKQFAEDLISDIQGALKGQLPWSAVDRGMLLAGPPGTGKTTLAKAIAKACGVRFIAVSAATWQSAGYLDSHLRAMRASFTEARRYAPSILFIDEMDSFSNRENHTGSSAGYHTEVVNALLAEIQGFNDQKPVFVIGATNFPNKVDPALRRSGRLDKLVYIPHPNVEALTSIYDYYLADTELIGQKYDDVDTKFLGGISFGITGADVESFVRGAVRRARKMQAPLCQQHLIDEITGKSRYQNSGRLSPEEMHRVAVHEAGHALLQILSGNQQLAYVSIVPRENGSLGFVANMPSSQNMRTRKQYLEHLQVVLAGRAAEEIVFGKDNISGSAGGDSQHSDLAVATKLATNLVCSLAMGKTSTLIWGNNPSEDQQDEIEKLLQEAYNTALARLEAHRKSLDVLSKALVEKQELMGSEVIKIVETK